MIACSIKFRGSKDFARGFAILVKHGFVFTSDHRYKIIPKDAYHDWDTWRYIYVGHDGGECKMIMNTAGWDNCWPVKQHITFSVFLKKILPKW